MKKLFLLLALLACSCSNTQVAIHNIPNLRMVDVGVYRGGQPASTNDWQFLKTLGVTNVVKLNLEKESSDDPARGLGLTVCYYPIDIWQQVDLKPSPMTISNAVAHITPGTYFHCEHGQDRTGLVAACYRIRHDHWDKKTARQEMLQDGFHRVLHGLDDFFEDDVH